MNARDLLTQAQITRPEQTALAEESERLLTLTPVQFQPTANTAEGVVGKTTNGGELTVYNGAQNFTPTLGESYQLQFGPGQARLSVNSKAEQPTEQQSVVNAIVATRSPAANDPGQRDQLWLNVNQDITNGVRLAETWVFVSQLGAWHLISGGTPALATLFGDGKPSKFTFGSTASGDDYDTPTAGQIFINTHDDTNRPYLWTGSAWVSQQTKHYDMDQGIPFADNVERGDFATYTNASGCKFLACRGSTDWENYDYETEASCAGGDPNPPWVGACENNTGADVCT